jgi:hypothetical protein
VRPQTVVAFAQVVGVALIAIGLGLLAAWAALLWLGGVLLVGGLRLERYLQAEQSQEVDRARSNEAA